MPSSPIAFSISVIGLEGLAALLLFILSSLHIWSDETEGRLQATGDYQATISWPLNVQEFAIVFNPGQHFLFVSEAKVTSIVENRVLLVFTLYLLCNSV